MTNDDILRKFMRDCPNLTKESHGIIAIYVHPNIPLKEEKKIRDWQRLRLGDAESIYYIAYHRYKAFAITTNAIYCTTRKDSSLRIPWLSIARVYSDGIIDCDGDNYHFELRQIAEYDRYHSLNDEFILWLNNLVDVIQQEHERYNVDNIKNAEQLRSVCKQYKKILSDIHDANDKKRFLEALAEKCYDFYEVEKNVSGMDSPISKDLGEYTMDICETYLQQYLGNADIYFFKGMLLGEKSDVNAKYESLRCMRSCMNHADKSKIDQRLRNELKNKALSFAANFLSMPPRKRQFLVIDDSLSYLESQTIIVLPQELPETIHFPMGHPQEHVLYIKHPFIDDYYIPYETSEFELFKDKMDELRRVLQAMGATHITISDTKNLENSNSRKTHTNVDTNISAKINSLKGNADLSRKESSYESLLNEYGTESTYTPTKKPYIPDGLVWYPNESSWQRLFEERKDGLAHYKLTISSKSSTSLTRMQEQKIKTDFKALILHIDASLEHEATETFEQNASATWELEIDFAPLEQLIDDSGNEEKPSVTKIPENTPSNNNCETADEAAYLEEVKFCLEDDGQIDEKERRMLERIRIKYDIDKSRAEELERTLIQGTAEEEEFRTAVREYLEDGELTEKDNALLARLANRLGITPERAEELKKQVADE